MKIELKDRGNDRNISLHFHLDYEEQRTEVGGLEYELNRELGVDVFRQGDSGKWLMFEFWTSDMDKIMEAVEYVEKKFGQEVE